MILFRICSSVILVIGLWTFGYADEHFPFLAEVSKKSVNIRAGANTNFERLDQLSQGQEIVVLAKSFDWYKVQLPATAKAFIRADYLKITQQPLAELTGDKVHIRAAANSDAASLGFVKKGEKVKLIAQVNEWWQIEAPIQAAGWIRQDFLTLKSQKVPEALMTRQVTTAVVSPDLKINEYKGRLRSASAMSYELQLEDGTIYYVRSIPNIDRFKGARVLVKGFIASDEAKTYTYPVLHALNVSLLL